MAAMSSPRSLPVTCRSFPACRAWPGAVPHALRSHFQQSNGDLDAALAAYFRDRDEVQIAESLCTRAHTLCTLALLVHVPVHTCKTHATLQHAHATPHAAGGRAFLRVLGRPLAAAGLRSRRRDS